MREEEREVVFDITELVVQQTVETIDQVGRNHQTDVHCIYLSFREFEKAVIRAMCDEMYKKYPYDYNYRMTLCTDVSARKIAYIYNKN